MRGVTKALAVFLVAAMFAACSGDDGSNDVDAGPQPGRDHWHAALGVYNCDDWMSDRSGDGVWKWPYVTSQGAPGRAGTDTYAGLHSHGDGIIHMEPAAADESGSNATLGNYFKFGGWKVSNSGFDFLGTERNDGDDCNGKPGVLKWATGTYTGSTSVTFKEQTGDPADFKLNDEDVIIVTFLPEDVDVAKLGDPPSVAHLPGAATREGQSV
jgi:hypothetical protein